MRYTLTQRLYIAIGVGLVSSIVLSYINAVVGKMTSVNFGYVLIGWAIGTVIRKISRRPDKTVGFIAVGFTLLTVFLTAFFSMMMMGLPFEFIFSFDIWRIFFSALFNFSDPRNIVDFLWLILGCYFSYQTVIRN